MQLPLNKRIQAIENKYTEIQYINKNYNIFIRLDPASYLILKNYITQFKLNLYM